MRAATVSLSAISRLGYDDEKRVLSIWFRDRGRYLYFDVPRSIYDTLRASASSPGRIFNGWVKGRYRCTYAPKR